MVVILINSVGRTEAGAKWNSGQTFIARKDVWWQAPKELRSQVHRKLGKGKDAAGGLPAAGRRGSGFSKAPILYTSYPDRNPFQEEPPLNPKP